MHTPAHIAASLLAYRDQTRPLPVIAATCGAVLPDAPMFLFYAYQKVCQTPEREIWSTKYFETNWQLFFDVFNSMPLTLLLWGVSRWMGWKTLSILAGSVTLHLLLDLPLHHDDGHRHFLPFSNWRFASPVSYWDPNHFGLLIAPLEFIGAVTALIWVCIQNKSRSMRVASCSTLSVYALAIIVGVAVWLAILPAANP
ncbi:MAG: hypothetical protein AAGD07_16730 [Planctomycetota bacterium]